MTSEIALMNRQAIALAADSAVTVTYWRDGERKERYFKGANKIFNLSVQAPIALMINDSADLLGVPWEVIAKAYREKLGSRQLDKLEDYVSDFLKFIESNKYIYPDSYRQDRFISDVITSSGFLLFLSDIRSDIDKEKDLDKRKELFSPRWEGLEGRVARAEFFNGITQEYVDSLFEKYADVLIERGKKDETVARYLDIVDARKLIQMAVIALHKRGMSVLASSGIVIAGFGANDFFPKLQIYQHFGMALDRSFCVQEADGHREISHGNVSEVIPLAQSDMVKTFINGASSSLFREIQSAAMESFEAFEGELKNRNLLADEASGKEAVEAAYDRFGDVLTRKLIASHTMPMKRVVGLLPIDELAELAEILIRIESLKERVTRESEQVGGPIDVAVISKGDGFIWIKRKHYFDPELNPRYFLRKGTMDHARSETAQEPARKVRSRSKKTGPS